jgi:hypothetical protein
VELGKGISVNSVFKQTLKGRMALIFGELAGDGGEGLKGRRRPVTASIRFF